MSDLTATAPDPARPYSGATGAYQRFERGLIFHSGVALVDGQPVAEAYP